MFASLVMHNVHINQQPLPVWRICCVDRLFLVAAVTRLLADCYSFILTGAEETSLGKRSRCGVASLL